MARHIGGHQIGCELNAPERAIKSLGNGAHQQRFAQPRYAFDQHVSARGQRDQRLLDHLVLPNHGLGDFIAHGRHETCSLSGLLIG